MWIAFYIIANAHAIQYPVAYTYKQYNYSNGYAIQYPTAFQFD